MNVPALSPQALSSLLDLLGSVRHGNWTGADWSAGEKGLDSLSPEQSARPGVTDLDNNASKPHDLAYLNAEHELAQL